MTTPIYDFITKYSKTHPVRPHMPGHKGRPPFDSTYMKNLYAMDITEIEGADSLFEADGIIKESEENATKLFETAGTFYSCGGSTLCIQAMLFLMKQEKRHVFAMRNCHRAFLNACILLNIDVTWLYPQQTEGILSGKVPVSELEKMLSACNKSACVYLTSPDYVGNISDIASVSKICKKYNARLLVDNAHGAHLAFGTSNRHPIKLGADLCCDSAHKMLPALTGAAYLHTSDPELAKKAKYAMSIFGSTSPSYLILTSLDLCNMYLEKNIRDDIERMQREIKQFHSALSEFFRFSFGDLFHVTIYAKQSGTTGYAINKYLKEERIFPEYVDEDMIILLFSPVTDKEEMRGVTLALLKAGEELKCKSNKALPISGVSTCRLEQAMPMRGAALADYEEIPVETAVGRICAGVKVPCPPAVPIAVSGERISSECIEIFEHYKIKTVCVVKNQLSSDKNKI